MGVNVDSALYLRCFVMSLPPVRLFKMLFLMAASLPTSMSSTKPKKHPSRFEPCSDGPSLSCAFKAARVMTAMKPKFSWPLYAPRDTSSSRLIVPLEVPPVPSSYQAWYSTIWWLLPFTGLHTVFSL